MNIVNINIDLQIPKPKYEAGIILERQNKNNNKSIIFQITKIIYNGTIIYCKECDSTFTSIKDYIYEGVIQINSFSDNINCYPIRPGKQILYKREEIEGGDENIILKNDFLITIADNKLNIKQREADWRSHISNLLKRG